MDFRIKKENLEYKLNEDFFFHSKELKDSLNNIKGMFTLYPEAYFGIKCNQENGEIIKDNHNPEAYKEYLEIIKKETSKGKKNE